MEKLIEERVAELREKARKDDKALFNTGKRIGKEEAQKETKEQIAKKLLALNIPIEKISEATELSIEEIKNISNN